MPIRGTAGLQTLDWLTELVNSVTERLPDNWELETSERALSPHPLAGAWCSWHSNSTQLSVGFHVEARFGITKAGMQARDVRIDLEAIPRYGSPKTSTKTWRIAASTDLGDLAQNVNAWIADAMEHAKRLR